MDTSQPLLDPRSHLRAGLLLCIDILLITIGIHYIQPLSELLAASYFIPIVAAAYWWEAPGALLATTSCLILYAAVSLSAEYALSAILQQLVIKGILFYFAGYTTSLISREKRQLLYRLHKDEIQTIGALAAAIDAKDHYTRAHSDHVMEYAVMIGKTMGLPADQLELLEYQAMLHDVGNIGVPDGLLNKLGEFTPEETEIMRGHVSISVDILKRIDNEGKLGIAVGQHHERHDGGGYPKGLKGDEILLNGRILAVADSFAAMVADRPYRKALPIDQAITELKASSGSQFDPQIVEAFLKGLAEQQRPG